MQVLWDLQSATVADVVSRLKSNYSTVQTMLRILETKGYVAHEKAGRAFAYRPLIDQKQARRRALSHLVSGLFDNSPSLLVLNVLEDERHRSARARPAPPVNHGERIVESALPALVNWLWQGSAIALAATAILRPSRRISATTRYQLWWIALFIVLALPILSFQLPASSFQQAPATSHAREFAAGMGAGRVPGSGKLGAGSWKLGASLPRGQARCWHSCGWRPQRFLSHGRRSLSSRSGESSARRAHFRKPARPGSTRGSCCAPSAGRRGWWFRITSMRRRCSV